MLFLFHLDTEPLTFSVFFLVIKASLCGRIVVGDWNVIIVYGRSAVNVIIVVCGRSVFGDFNVIIVVFDYHLVVIFIIANHLPNLVLLFINIILLIVLIRKFSFFLDYHLLKFLLAFRILLNRLFILALYINKQ